MSNYAKNSDLKNETGVDKSQFAKKDDLANLKSEVDKLDNDKLAELDNDKLKPVPVDSKKLSDVVDVKEGVYNGKIKDIEDKIPNITNLATNATLNAKINEVEDEIRTIINLATTAALTTVENKTPNACDLVRIADYDTTDIVFLHKLDSTKIQIVVWYLKEAA